MKNIETMQKKILCNFNFFPFMSFIVQKNDDNETFFGFNLFKKLSRVTWPNICSVSWIK
jgi:hypothetical protein